MLEKRKERETEGKKKIKKIRANTNKSTNKNNKEKTMYRVKHVTPLHFEALTMDCYI